MGEPKRYYRARCDGPNMIIQSTDTDLFRSCRTLFSEQTRITVDFLRLLSLSDIKSAYRNRVMENHPDRAKLLGRDPDELERHFRAINEAYLHLAEFVQKNNSRSSTTEIAHRFSFRAQASGPVKPIVPATELLLGQFLFYQRRISINTLADAVFWQRKQRPSYGKIAIDWKIMTVQDITRILAARDHNEKIGEYALRNGYVTDLEHKAILGRQHMLQKPIGCFFVERGIVDPEELQDLVRQLRRHNAAVRRMRSH